MADAYILHTLRYNYRFYMIGILVQGCTMHTSNCYCKLNLETVKRTSFVICSVQNMVIFIRWFISHQTMRKVTSVNTIDHPLLQLRELFILVASFVTICRLQPVYVKPVSTNYTLHFKVDDLILRMY